MNLRGSGRYHLITETEVVALTALGWLVNINAAILGLAGGWVAADLIFLMLPHATIPRIWFYFDLGFNLAFAAIAAVGSSYAKHERRRILSIVGGQLKDIGVL